MDLVWTQRATRARTGRSADVILLPSAMAGDDTETIRAVLRGDVDRYAELVGRYQEPAIRLAFSLLGDHEDARDAAQEAFVNAYRSLARFRGGAAFSTWLYRIVVNQCKDAYRRRSRQPVAVARVGERDEEEQTTLFVEVDDPAAGPGDQLANRELGHVLTRTIGALPERQRAAFLLHHVHGMPVDEVAGVMGCRPGTAKAHLFRATSRLRAQLSPWLITEGIR